MPVKPSPSSAETFTLVWLTGPSCDGCTIGALGERTAGGLEALLAGASAGLPRIRLVHPALSFETGDRFIELMRRAMGLPVINLPGCCAPPILLSTLAVLLRHARGDGPPLELDDTNRPREAYPETWKGALPVWTE